MDEETIRDRTFCCGGGGGLLTDDLMEIRVKGAQPRVEALNNVMQEKGVTHMAAICAICKSQFTKVLPYYGMDMDQIVSVHQLVSNALILTGQTATTTRTRPPTRRPERPDGARPGESAGAPRNPNSWSPADRVSTKPHR
jgi:hypothetical protein